MKNSEYIESAEINLDKSPTNHPKPTPIKTKLFYIIVFILISTLAILIMMRFYSTSYYCEKGKNITISLPCGSSVTLFEKTTLTYYPLWWNYTRRVVLSGEASFDITKGVEFKLASQRGMTISIGSNFNLYARNYKYQIESFEGTVKVISNSQQTAIVSTGYMAEITPNGEIKTMKYIKEDILTD